ncbi:MAG: guanylate kinase [Actinomycetaceae bacterium]|nr:guanylate kinase [Actinomycetaceae bacterium]
MSFQSVSQGDAVPLFVIAGPSGVGKGTIVSRLLDASSRIWISISATTRPSRPGETEGVHYYFVTDEEFDRLIDEGEMLEWAYVHGKHRYGTPRQPVLEAQAQGLIPLLEIDLDGARQIRKSMPEAVQIFIEPPSMEELERRLRGRGTEDEEEIARRMETARGEMAARDEFDVRIVNRDVSGATRQILHLMGLDK